MDDGSVFCYHCHEQFRTEACIQLTECIWVCAGCAPSYYEAAERLIVDMEESLDEHRATT